MATNTLIFIIVGMAAVTVLPRVIPFLLVGNRPLPRGWVLWLSYVPPALIAAMVLPQIMLGPVGKNPTLGSEYLVAAIPTFIAGYFTRSIFLCVVVGMASLALLRLL